MIDFSGQTTPLGWVPNSHLVCEYLEVTPICTLGVDFSGFKYTFGWQFVQSRLDFGGVLEIFLFTWRYENLHSGFVIRSAN
jgi:hypothetical protein